MNEHESGWVDFGFDPNSKHRAFPVAAEKDSIELDTALIQEQLRLLSNNLIDLPINLVNALIVSWVFRKLFPAQLVVLWLSVFLFVILFRFLSRRRFQRGQYDLAAMRRWATHFTLSAFAMGCLWGLTACIVLITVNPLDTVFIVFVLVGMTVGGIAVNSAYLPAVYGFLFPTIVPVVIVLAVQRKTLYWPMAWMVAVLAVVLAVVARSINNSILNNVRLRVGQRTLTDQLRANETIMAEVQRIAQVGGIEVMEGGQRIICTDETLKIFGIDRARFIPNAQTIITRIHQEDRVAVTQTLDRFLRLRQKEQIACRIVLDNGDLKYVQFVGQTLEPERRSSMRFFITVQDVTARKQDEEKLAFAYLMLNTQMEASPDGIGIVDANQKIITSNHQFAKIWNVSKEALDSSSGDLVLSAVASLQKDPVAFRTRAAYLYAHPGEDEQDELETIDGRCIDRHTNTLFGPDGKYLGRAWFFRDITERKKAAEQLAYRDRLLHAVTEGTRILVKADSPDDGMASALRIVGNSLGVDRVIVMQERGGAIEVPAQIYAWTADTLQSNFVMTSFVPSPAEATDLANWRAPLWAGTPVIGQLQTAATGVRSMFTWFHNKSVLMVPVFVGKLLWGSLVADSTSITRDWTATEIDTLRTFGDMAGALIVQHQSQMALQTSEERFRVLGSTAADAIIMMDGAGKISSWNKSAERILGFTALEAIGHDLHELLTPPRFLAKAVESMKEFRATGTGPEVGITRPLKARRKDGVEIEIEISMAAALVGTEWQAIGILRDVTERNRIEANLQFANILLTTEMAASLDGILVVDADRKIISSNARFAEIWQTPKGNIESGEDAGVLASGQLMLKDPETFATLVEKLYQNTSTSSDDELEMLDGRIIERHTVPLTTESGGYLGRAWFFRDVTERRLAEALAIRSAHFDVLTGLVNRSVFVEAVNAAVARAQRGGLGFAVIYLDLDHFKDVNDTLGHPLGDALLMEVAGRLLANTRSVDTVARFGGDEFAIVLADINSPTDAATVAEKLIMALNVPYLIRGNQIYSGASIGIDVFGPDAADAEVLLSHADVALYRTKQGGRNSYRFFTDAMDKEVRTQVSLGTELHEALERGEFFLEYQPQVTIADSHIVGVEALIRWRHPKRGILCPDIFIPIAEKTGMIIKIGKWALQTACAQMRAWTDAGITPIRLAVNVSAIQFKSPKELENEITQTLQTTGLSAKWLELELTESVLMNVTREHSDIMVQLRKLGISLAIDDFGTGFSSLAYLRRFPVDRIKIDQNFVLHLGSEVGAASIVRATIGLGRELGMAVIAEGVETAQQLALLTSWGCQEVQGFYFSRPLPAADIKRILLSGGIIVPGLVPTATI